MNVTIKQKEMLLLYLQENLDLVRGRVNKNSESRKEMNAMWDAVAVYLNTAEGPQKNGKEWAKTWKDIKGYILKKEAKRRSYSQRTGGGLPPKIAFSTFEEAVLQLLTPEATGLNNIPEGGITNEIHDKNDDIGQIENTEIDQHVTNIDAMETRHISYEQNMDNNLVEIEENENSENIPHNNIPIQNVHTIREKASRKGQSLQQLSNSMLDIQKRKLQLKEEEIKLKRKNGKVQKRMLLQLKHIRSQLNHACNGENI